MRSLIGRAKRLEPGGQIIERAVARALVFVDPTFGNLLEGRRIQVVELFASPPKWDDQLGFDQKSKVFGDALPCDVEMAAELVEGLTIVRMELVEQGAAAGVGEGFENGVHRLCNQTVA